MTRRSERELEYAIDDLDGDDTAELGDDIQLVVVDPETGEHRTPDGERVNPDARETLLRIGGPPPEVGQ